LQVYHPAKRADPLLKNCLDIESTIWQVDSHEYIYQVLGRYQQQAPLLPLLLAELVAASSVVHDNPKQNGDAK
jgi:hypothetical protein